MKRLLVVGCICAALMGIPGLASAATLTMDEFGPTLANGLTFNGVTFTFLHADPTQATYGTNAPSLGGATYLDDRVLDGPADGVLQMDFLNPVNFIEFGIATSDNFFVANAGQVQLLSPTLTPISTTSFDLTPLDIYGETLFSYAGGPVSRVLLSFNAGFFFAIDNLTYTEVPPPTSEVPEPATMTLLGLGLAGVRFARRRNR